MKIDFNNVRKQLVYSYEDLVKKLNDSIVISDEQYAKPRAIRHNTPVNIKGYVLIDSEELQSDMDNMRQLIGAIAMTYTEGDDNFKDVFKEIYTGENQSMPVFNEEEDELV